MSAETLLGEFDWDEAGANAEYLDEWVRVDGAVESVEDEKVTLSGGLQWDGPALVGINCQYNAEQSDIAQQLNFDDTTYVLGKVSGYDPAIGVTLNPCTILTDYEPPTPPDAGPAPTLTPVPTPAPTPAPTPRAALQPIRSDFAAAIQQARDADERRVRREIDALRESMPEFAGKIEGLPWVKDGIDGRNEMRAVVGLIKLANEGFTEEWENLTSEPWVVEGSNHAALTFPVTRHTFGSRVWTLNDALTRIFSHPLFNDGISAQEAKILTVLSDSDITRPAGTRLADLDFAVLGVEERIVALPLSGETELSIVRTGPGGAYAMDGLEHSLRGIEEFMGHPFPLQQVIYLIDNRVTGWGAAKDTHVVIGADELKQTIFWRGRFGQANREWILDTIAHEAAHHYWRDGPRWLNEGAATFMEAVVADALRGPLQMEGVLCPVPSIAASQSQSANCFNSCPYVLGEGLFRGLYRAMDDDTAFRLAFRRLYLHSQHDLPDSGCGKDEGVETVCHLREAFAAYAPEGRLNAVEQEIARWFDGVAQQSVALTITGPQGQPQPFGVPDEKNSQVMLRFVGPDRWVVDELIVDQQGNVLREVRGNHPENYRVESLDGTFDMVMPSGSFAVEVLVLTYPSSEFIALEFIGWYDGKGGLTTDPEEMGQMTIGADGGLTFEIRLPGDVEDLLCPSGQSRRPSDGLCYPGS